MVSRKVVLFPGSFNPVTKAHFEIAEAAANRVNADTVIFIPAKDKYISRKNCDIIPGKDRHDLIRLSAPASDIKFFVSGIEVEDPAEDCFTYNTVEAFKLASPTTDFYVLLGADNIPTLTSWYSWEKFVANNKFVFVSRDRELEIPKELIKYHFYLVVTDKGTGISSTKVREAAAALDFDYVEKICGPFVANYYKERKNEA